MTIIDYINHIISIAGFIASLITIIDFLDRHIDK